MRLTRRGRFVAVLVVIAAVYGIFGLGRAIAGSAPQPAAAQPVVVQPGESLWSIAVRQFPGTDPRDAVDKLRSLNHLASSVVHPGQQLRLR